VKVRDLPTKRADSAAAGAVAFAGDEEIVFPPLPEPAASPVSSLPLLSALCYAFLLWAKLGLCESGPLQARPK